MSMPRIAMRLNHVAYPTFDTAETVRFTRHPAPYTCFFRPARPDLQHMILSILCILFFHRLSPSAFSASKR